jgi:DNA-binding response OmpR family regulator
MNNLVLLIDDDEDEFQILKDALQRCLPSYICTWVQNKDDALKFLEDITPTVILLDLNMPKISGIDCLKILKNSEKHKNIPVILYSTCITGQTRDKAHRLGALRCLEKTANIKSLVEELIQALVSEMNIRV